VDRLDRPDRGRSMTIFLQVGLEKAEAVRLSDVLSWCRRGDLDRSDVSAVQVDFTDQTKGRKVVNLIS
jgi:hypothetical protein